MTSSVAYDPNDILFGASTPSAKFTSPGDNWQGTITKLDSSQQHAYDAKNPGVPGPAKVWPDGRPMMQVIVTVQTDIRDPQVPDDDGQRRIFIKGKNLTDGVRDAVKAAGARRLDVGGWLSVTFTHETPNVTGSGNPAKNYTVEYRKPDGGANAALGISAQDVAAVQSLQLSQQRAQQPVQPVAAAPAAAPAGAQVNLDGVDPAVAAKIQAMLAAQNG